MKRPLRHPARSIRGLTLIELLVSLVIGLIVVLATVSTYLGSSRASRVADTQGRMNEDAHAALTILSQQLRMAGNNPKQPNRTVESPRNPIYDGSTYIVRGCNSKFSNITTIPAVSIPALDCAVGASTTPNSIAISYEADSYNTVATSTGVPTDCLGQSLTAQSATVTTVTVPVGGGAPVTDPAGTATFYVADNRFYIGTSGVITAPSLYCKGNGNTVPQPLVENVEDLQFTYGTGPAMGALTAVVGYLDSASLLTQPNLAVLPDDPARWARVVTVRICVLMRSENPIVDNAASARYTKCDGTDETNPPDLRLRRAYATTVVLRNRLTDFN